MRFMRRLVRFLKPYQLSSILALLMIAGGVAMELAVPRLTQRIIDQGIARHDLPLVISTALWMIGASVAGALSTVGNTILAVRVTQHFAADLRSAIYRQIQTFSFGNLDHLQTGQLMVRLTSDVSQAQQIVLLSLRVLTRWPLLMVGSFILLILTSWQLALIMLVILPVGVGVIWFFASKMQPLFSQVQRRLDALNQILQENLAGVRVVKAFVRADRENARFGQANDALAGRTIQVIQLLSMLLPTWILSRPVHEPV